MSNFERRVEQFAQRPIRFCHYCGRLLTPETATEDHRLALSRGGRDVASNIVLACRDCNTRKGSMDYEAFKSAMLPVKQAVATTPGRR